MIKYIKPFTTRLITVLLTSLICFLAFKICTLEEVFDVQITYVQWLGISTISVLLFTQPVSDKKE
jgi:predicted ferric reductase